MENAHLPAIGTAARLLENGSVAPSDMKVGIIGYGRIGEKLTHILMFLGASIKVFTSKSELRRRLCMLGIRSVDYNSEEEMALSFGELDILVNTAPARLIGEDSAKRLSGKRVIELASGENLPRSLGYERMASIPAVTFPKSAGRAIARSVDRALKIN
jgi:alanine dehydrogenase